MAKKYLSLEEAAKFAGMSVEQLKQLRERGEIRGFSDGGTWKFKSDDVEELMRSHQTDSNPDVPLLTDEELDSGSSIIGMEEEDLVSEQPTVIRGSSALDDDDDDAFLVGMSSDSDVQLMPNELLTDDGGVDMVSLGDSDSDVRLVDNSPALLDYGSDSDVKLVGGSDSDVQIVGGSDSDVRIMEDDSDSDVQLVEDAKTEHDMPVMEEDSDSDVALVAPSGSGVAIDMGDTDASVFDEDESGINLGDGSSITIAAESGISLEKIDSDLELKAKAGKKPGDDSDLKLNTDDSGISLEGFEDSGLSLMDDDDGDFIGLADDSGIELSPADSGIALESLADSGIALDRGKSGDRTLPMIPKAAGTDDDDTAMEMPMLDDSEFELSMDGTGSGSDNIIMFDDADEIDDRMATVVKKSGEASEEFDLTGDGKDFDLEDSFDEFDEDADFGGEEFDEDLDVVEDVVGEDDELDDLDVFDEGADDFDDDFDAGTSSPDFVGTGAGGHQAAIPAPVQADWGAAPFAGLLLSTLLMVFCGMMMFDLVRSMWSWNDPSSFNSPLLGIVRDMIK
jgi:excisionase family DNA binding protein